MISRETIEEISMRIDIESLVSGYVALKRAGSNLKGLCPFHSEKSPSFTVYPSSNSFYCFGCGAGGDQFSFIMRAENLDYPDAIQFLAKRAGITIVDNDPAYGVNEPKYDKARFYKMNADAARFFHNSLWNDNADARRALSYFTENRRLLPATIKHFGLGYAPASSNPLLRHMTALGYTEDELVAGYLCMRNEKGRVYDAFRNRVMFPVIDVSGNVVAFGGRVLDDSKPKYLNSSDTPVFKKSRNLFALNFAKASCQESLILCEGYMDVIALHAVGISNAVATLGTAITSEQARIISRYTKKVIISYDADEAGQIATKRAMKLLEDAGLEVSVLSIPNAKDPDEYIKNYGVEKFKEVIGVAKSKFDFRLDSIIGAYDLSLPQDKIDALKKVETLISHFYSKAERDVYIQVVSERFGVPKAAISADVEAIVLKNSRTSKREENAKVRESTVGYMDRINPDFIKAPTVARNEENLLGLLFLYPDHRHKVFGQRLVSSDDFFTELGKKMFDFLKKAYDESDEHLLSMNDAFTPEEVGRITKIKVSRMQFNYNDEAVLLDCIEALKSSMDKKRIENVGTSQELQALIEAKRQ